MKLKWFGWLLFVLACLCVAVSVCYVYSFSTNGRIPMESEYHLLMDPDGWEIRMPDGVQPAVLGQTVTGVGSQVTISRTVFPEEMGENVLLFQNERQCVSVQAEGETLFQLGAGVRRYKLTATGYCTAPLPEIGRPYVLKVTFLNLSDGTCAVPEFYFGTPNDILIFICMLDIVPLATIPLWVLLAAALAILSVYQMRKRVTEPRIISLSLFLLAAAAWSITDLNLITLFCRDMELISTVSYYLMMLMPIPAMYFIWSSCKNIRFRFGRLLLYLILLNVPVQTALFLLNIASMHQMLLISQAYLMLMLFYGVAATVLDYRAERTAIGRVQALAFIGCSALGGIVVIVYWIQPGSADLYRALFQLTIFVFLAAMLGVLMFSIEQRRYISQAKDAEIHAYRAISTIDQLTGLNNRRAFDLRMEEIQNDPERYPDAVLVFMDLNGLKYANDKYGHLAGDELIIAAGKSITAGFGSIGDTYRIGGDEFAAIVVGSGVNTAECYQRMDSAIEQYNRTTPIPLSLARGSCTLVNVGGQRLSASDWKMLADKKMYEDKVFHRRVNANGSAEDYLEIISSFVSAVDAKDSYTADHSQRVATMTDRICHMLGLSDASTDQIRIAACLHDIGKIGIPDNILCKRDKLTEAEWRIMQSHTIVGEEIVKHTRAFYDVSQIIRHHHERVDGNGYPDGIAGAEIPLGSRIIAIADSIDAMTSSRSYRDAKTLDYCREEISRNLGIMYDAAIGSIVLEHWSEIEAAVMAMS